MPSPFPGMNPYLEQTAHWQDFHGEFLASLRRQLIPRLAPEYIVQVQEHLYIHDLPPEPRRLVGYADVSVARPEGPASGQAAIGVLEVPAEVQLPLQDVERVRYLEIRDRKGQELVTVIELLSPTNKRPGEDREQYLAKRRDVLRTLAHFIEIDLLRGWAHMPLDNRPDCDYSILVSRTERRPTAQFWPIRLRERLPVIPIPLRAPDSDVAVDLQEVLHRAYEGTGYERFLYRGTPDPPLSPDDAAWAQQFVPARP
jgi:Protein of unknown function (DUF4058)